MTQPLPFWEQKTLAEMTSEEWKVSVMVAQNVA